MSSDSALRITDTVTIPLAELHFQFSRSGGPGGQHVNRTATQVELLFDVRNSPSLNEAQRARVLVRLASYMDSRGMLHLTSQTTRSQYRNRADVIERFQRLLRDALRVPKPRRPTHPSAGATEQRLQEKRRTSTRKQERRRQGPEEDGG
jgi:ribosome-associated protein